MASEVGLNPVTLSQMLHRVGTEEQKQAGLADIAGNQAGSQQTGGLIGLCRRASTPEESKLVTRPSQEESVDLRGESPPERSPTYIIHLCVVTLTGILAFNISCFFHLKFFAWEDRIDDQKWCLANSKVGAKTVILGDSSALMGLLPAAFVVKSDRQTINLARHAGPITLEDAWLLQRYLQQNPPPKRVLAIYSYITLWSDNIQTPKQYTSMAWDRIGFGSPLKPVCPLNLIQQGELALRFAFPLIYRGERLKPVLVAPWNAYREMALVNLSSDGFLDAPADPQSVRILAKGNLARIAATPELNCNYLTLNIQNTA